MRRIQVIVVGLIAASLLTVGAATSLANSGHGPKTGAITIESWLLANVKHATDLSGTVTACFKLDGDFVDQGGAPTWTDETSYESKSTKAGQCEDWTPVGGYNFSPSNGSEDSTLYAVHTITGQKGQIFITFAGSYNLVSTFQGEGTWVVTGGTGAYEGVHGQGTWTADATTFPYIRHTEYGTLTR